jgi:hypothetical protein
LRKHQHCFVLCKTKATRNAMASGTSTTTLDPRDDKLSGCPAETDFSSTLSLNWSDDDEGEQSSRTTTTTTTTRNNNIHFFQRPNGPDPWLDLRSKPIIDSVHDGLPRFGHSNDLLSFINGRNSGDVNAQKDYAIGLLAWIVAIGGFFFLWSLLICALTYAGEDRVGVLSGHQPKRPEKPSHHHHQKKKRRRSSSTSLNSPRKSPRKSPKRISGASQSSTDSSGGLKLVQKDGVMVAVVVDSTTATTTMSPSKKKRQQKATLPPPPPPLFTAAPTPTESTVASKARQKKRELEAKLASSLIHPPPPPPQSSTSTSQTLYHLPKKSSMKKTTTTGTSTTTTGAVVVVADAGGSGNTQEQYPDTTHHSPGGTPFGSPLSRLKKKHIRLEDDAERGEEEQDATATTPTSADLHKSPRRARKKQHHVSLVEDEEGHREYYNNHDVEESRPSARDPDNPEHFKQALALRMWRARIQMLDGRLRRIRIVALISGVCLIVATIVAVYHQGVTQTYLMRKSSSSHNNNNNKEEDPRSNGLLAQGLETAHDGIQQLQQSAYEGISLMEQVLRQQELVHTTSLQVLELLNGFCPTVRTPLCSPITGYCDYSDIPYPAEVKDTMSYLDGTIDSIVGNLTDYARGFQGLVDRTNYIEDSMQQLHWSMIWLLYVVLGLTGIIGSLIVLRMGALMWRGGRPRPDVSSLSIWIRTGPQPQHMLPLLMILLLVLCVLALACSSSLVGAVDFCASSSGTPEPNVLAMLERDNNKDGNLISLASSSLLLSPSSSSSELHDFLVFFIQGTCCRLRSMSTMRAWVVQQAGQGVTVKNWCLISCGVIVLELVAGSRD